MSTSNVGRLLLACAVISGCAGAKREVARPEGLTSANADKGGAWQPGAGAAAALDELWKAKAFALPAARLAQASGGAVATMHKDETLLYEERVVLDAESRGVTTMRTVFRLLSDSPSNTLTFVWAPWRQERPQVRARVVTQDGAETWLDPATIVEGTVATDGLELTDVRQLKVPLPNARRGSVIEVEVAHRDTRPLIDGAGAMASYPLWSLSPVRRMRISVEAPASLPLAIETVGVERPAIARRGGTQRAEMDVRQIEFFPLRMTRSQAQARMPRFSWSTGTSWAEVGRRYHALIDEALADKIDVAALAPEVGAKATLQEKVQVVASWIARRVRYTAVNLGAGAIVPRRPSQVLARGFGDCKDLAVLMVVALRSLGIAAEPVAVRAGAVAPSEGLPGLAAFNHMIVAVPDGAGLLWIDATAPAYPAGVVPLPVRDQLGLLLAANPSLVHTPTRADTLFSIRETSDLTVAPFGAGKARLTLSSSGAAEGMLRGLAEACDERAARKIIENSVTSVLGQVRFTASVEHCVAGEGPLDVVAEVPVADSLDTGGSSVEIRLPARVVDMVVPVELRGEAPGSDQRTEAQKLDQANRALAETGFTEEEMKLRTFTFDSRATVERVYHIALPPHFVPGPLPENRTLAFGPASFSESWSRGGAASVEVRFRFDTGPHVEYTAEEVKSFRAAFWKRWQEPTARIVGVFEPLQLIEQKHAGEAVKLMRRWLDESPRDGLTRARYAETLLGLGLGDLAREQSDRSLADAPDDPMVLMACAEVALRGPTGAPFLPPFSRDKAIGCLRKAHAQLPDHNWAASVLADTLRRDPQGEAQSRWTSEVAEAAAVLEELAGRNTASADAMTTLLDIYLRCRRFDELARLVEHHPEIRNRTDAVLAAVIEALTVGLDGILRRLERIEDPKERLAALRGAYFNLAEMHRFDDATALLTRFVPGPALESEVATLRAGNQGLAMAPDAADLHDPESAARSVFAVIANAATMTEAGRRLAELASPSGKLELDGTTAVFGFVRMPSLWSSYSYNALFHRGACTTSGDHGYFRVRCELPDMHDIAATSYWVMAGKQLQLESLGRIEHMSERAWHHAGAGQLAEAALWLDWIVADLQSRKSPGSGAQLLADYWSESAHGDAAAVKYAAALSWIAYRDLVHDAPAAVLDVLARGREALSGSMRRRVDEALAGAYQGRHKYSEAVKTLAPLARSENEPRLYRWLASLEAKAGDGKAALALITKALDKDPANLDWRDQSATIYMRLGKYAEALATLKKLFVDRGDSVRNNLLWAHLMARELDDEVEREALLMGEDKQATVNALHTAAMVLLERGRVKEAAEIGQRRRARIDEMDDEQWLLRGRLLQLLGLDEASRQTYAKVGNEDPEIVELRRRYAAAH